VHMTRTNLRLRRLVSLNGKYILRLDFVKKSICAHFVTVYAIWIIDKCAQMRFTENPGYVLSIIGIVNLKS